MGMGKNREWTVRNGTGGGFSGSYLSNLFCYRFRAFLVVDCPCEGLHEFLLNQLEVEAFASFEGAEPFSPDLALVPQKYLVPMGVPSGRVSC